MTNYLELLSNAKDSDTIYINISSKWARHLFNCNIEYITNICHGRCCQGTDRILISLLPDEEQKHIANGQKVLNGLLQPNELTGKCPYKNNNGLCSIHGTPLKPFGCIASPFTINSGNTLIIRNRYSLMKCHGEGEPAYKTFRASLDLILGNDGAEKLCKALDMGANNLMVKIPAKNYYKILYLDSLKHN